MPNKAVQFVLSSFGIIASFLVVSVLTERRFKLSYDGEKFTYSCTMSVIYFFIVVVSAFTVKFVKGKRQIGSLFNRDLM